MTSRERQIHTDAIAIYAFLATLVLPAQESLNLDDRYNEYPALVGQDLLYFLYFEWSSKRILHHVQRFIEQADRNAAVPVGEADLISRQYQMMYRGIQTSASFGRGAVAAVPWISFDFRNKHSACAAVYLALGILGAGYVYYLAQAS